MISIRIVGQNILDNVEAFAKGLEIKYFTFKVESLQYDSMVEVRLKRTSKFAERKRQDEAARVVFAFLEKYRDIQLKK